MLHVLVSGEKTAFINIVAAQNPVEAVWLNTESNFVNYEDIPTAILRQAGGIISSDFITYPNYLTAAIAVFTDASLVSYAGIYNGKTEGSGLANPNILINTSIVGGITWSPIAGTLLIFNSIVDSITTIVSGGVSGIITLLTIASGSVVSLVTAITSGSSIGTINIRNTRNDFATLTQITQGSTIGIINTDAGAVFGGYGVNPVSGSCALNISAFTASNVLSNSITLSWTNPSGWLFNYLYYKRDIDNSWTSVDTTVGRFIGDTGFIFGNLIPNTLYDFRVNVKCINGVLGTYNTITQETTT